MTVLEHPWPEDPRLAEVYDVECAGRWDHDFYLALAAELEARSVVDVGCGTGVFALDAAARGLRAVGVDPAAAVLDVARAKTGADRVTWIEGDLDGVASASADLVIMMGHVAQYFLEDRAWQVVLEQVRRVLVDGGHLAFETRNPGREWATRWTKEKTETTYPHPGGGEFTSWVQMQRVDPSGEGYSITHEGNTLLPDGSHLRATETLRFRTLPEVRRSLEAAGFELVDAWGDWNRSPVSPERDEFIILARS